MCGNILLNIMNTLPNPEVTPYYQLHLSAVILDILQYGHPLLREECSPVVHINKDLLSFLD